MRVTREQSVQNRRRILDAAGRLFRQKGFDGIGVADIMKDAGLTHGGFYGHFQSKEDLAAQVCGQGASAAAARWTTLLEGAPADPLGTITASYLSEGHRDSPGQGCLLAALAAEAPRQPAPVRRPFTAGLCGLVAILERVVTGRTKAARREKALATMAGLVGAVILARAVDDPALSDEILAAANATFGRA